MKYLSRKFIIALAFTLAAIIGLFINKLTGAEFVALTGLLVGAFTVGDVAINAIHKRNSEE